MDASSVICTACAGKGFIEKNMGFVQVKCQICNGTGRVEATDVRFETDDAEPEKPSRKQYTRKSRKPRKPPKDR